MTKKITKESQQQFNFKLTKIEKIKFYENDPDEIGFNSITKDKVRTGIHTELEISIEKETIGIILDITFSNDNNSDLNLYGIKTKHTYKILKMSEIVKKINNDSFNIPDQLLTTLISIAYSDTRGMLAILVTNDKYKKIILPIVSPVKLLPQKSLKQPDDLSAD
ncbi:MAG: hypothetical protein KAS49_02555 [Candidatus Cloacimonetes bacterium]|nr:hypothetical protein [Candidatus Cloacimonadota bacterium]